MVTITVHAHFRRSGDITVHRIPLSRRNFFALSRTAALGAVSEGLHPLAWADEKTQKDAAGAINSFASDIYRKLADPESKNKERGNLFLSPFSIEVALAMTAAGARG